MSSGGGGGGGGGHPEWQQEAYNNFKGYAASASNPDINAWPGFSTLNPEVVASAQQGWQAGLQQRSMQDMMAGFEMPSFELPPGPSPEEIQRQKDEATFDRLLSERYDKATEAAAKVNALIDTNMARASLFGLQYDITPEKKTEMVNNEFASIWGKEKETQLQNLSEALKKEFDTSGVLRGEEPTATEPPPDTPAGGKVPASEKKTGSPAAGIDEGLLKTVSVF